MEYWLPPSDMTAVMLHFDFREGGSYRMRLTYKEAAAARGKTSDSTDVVDVSFIELAPGKRIVQTVRFNSDDPELSGSMRMTWTFDAVENGTIVTVTAEHVPDVISREDHEVGMNSTLDNLGSFLQLRFDRGDARRQKPRADMFR